jgi:hypothetical protein
MSRRSLPGGTSARGVLRDQVSSTTRRARAAARSGSGRSTAGGCRVLTKALDGFITGEAKACRPHCRLGGGEESQDRALSTPHGRLRATINSRGWDVLFAARGTALRRRAAGTHAGRGRRTRAAEQDWCSAGAGDAAALLVLQQAVTHGGSQRRGPRCVRWRPGGDWPRGTRCRVYLKTGDEYQRSLGCAGLSVPRARPMPIRGRTGPTLSPPAAGAARGGGAS